MNTQSDARPPRSESRRWQPRGWQLRGWSASFLLGAALVVVAACSSEGFTPDCPPLELYDVREEPEKSSSEERQRAINRGCVSPVDTTPPPEASAGAAGTGGD